MTSNDPPAPEAVFFSLTVECPMRCKVCSMWQLDDPPGALTQEQRLEVIDQLPGFERRVHVVVTGGEPFLKFAEILAIARRVRRQGNTMGLVTSGFFLSDGVLNRIVGSGLTHVAVSIDFPSAAQHDAQRGRAGTFARATAAIRRLVELRRVGADVPTVGINAIVMAQNLNYLEDLALLAADLGVKEILFQPIQPDFGTDDRTAFTAFRNWLPLDPSRVDAVLDGVEALRSRVPLGQGPDEFEAIRRYFRNPLHLPPGTCQSALRNLVVDVYGNVSHCFGQPRTGLPSIGTVPQGDLVTLWRSAVAQHGRRRLATCTLGCGALLCHSRSSIPTVEVAVRVR